MTAGAARWIQRSPGTDRVTVNTGTLWAVGALAAFRAIYPRILVRRHALKLPLRSDGVITGAEPFDLARPGAPAVLVLHGGGDTPQSMRALAEFLFARGYSVRVPLSFWITALRKSSTCARIEFVKLPSSFAIVVAVVTAKS